MREPTLMELGEAVWRLRDWIQNSGMSAPPFPLPFVDDDGITDAMIGVPTETAHEPPDVSAAMLEAGLAEASRIGGYLLDHLDSPELERIYKAMEAAR